MVVEGLAEAVGAVVDFHIPAILFSILCPTGQVAQGETVYITQVTGDPPGARIAWVEEDPAVRVGSNPPPLPGEGDRQGEDGAGIWREQAHVGDVEIAAVDTDARSVRGDVWAVPGKEIPRFSAIRPIAHVIYLSCTQARHTGEPVVTITVRSRCSRRGPRSAIIEVQVQLDTWGRGSIKLPLPYMPGTVVTVRVGVRVGVQVGVAVAVPVRVGDWRRP